ncbi:MAG: ferritin family protein [Syntrophobacterales bacterium]|jgi:rubrerythrin|nr:ferritin family protein [Syntrophobacterales bacterium]
MRDRLDALEIALSNETEEGEFYKFSAERTDNPLSKAMFEAIAKEEAEHYERLKELHEVWQQNQAWPAAIPLKVSKTKVQNVLQDVLQQLPDFPRPDRDDLEAIRAAIDFECEGVMYYDLMKQAATEPNEKAFFNLMANIEHEHYSSLKDTEELLRDPTAWSRRAKKSV